MRLVLDTNVFVSGVFWQGTPGRLLDAWVEERFELVASGPVLDELHRVIAELSQRYDHGDLASRWLVRLAEHAAVIDAKPRIKLCRDPDDDMYLDCAVQGGADALVSGDKDLLTLGHIGTIPILTPAQALRLLAG